MGSTCRLFIAINIPSQVRNYLSEVQVALKRKNKRLDAKWVPAELVHITLYFLGDMDESAVPLIQAHIATALAEVNAFTVQLAALGGFPSAWRPRVIWMGLAPSEALTNVHQSLAKEMMQLGIEVDPRPMAAHLTLARLRVPEPVEGFATRITPVSWTVSTIDFMESKLHPTGPTYTVLQSYALRSRR